MIIKILERFKSFWVGEIVKLQDPDRDFDNHAPKKQRDKREMRVRKKKNN